MLSLQVHPNNHIGVFPITPDRPNLQGGGSRIPSPGRAHEDTSATRTIGSRRRGLGWWLLGHGEALAISSRFQGGHVEVHGPHLRGVHAGVDGALDVIVPRALCHWSVLSTSEIIKGRCTHPVYVAADPFNAREAPGILAEHLGEGTCGIGHPLRVRTGILRRETRALR